MATAGGTPPTGVTPKPKREITPEQKRTFAGLGIAGVLALIVGVMYLPGLMSGGNTTVPVAPPSGAVTNGAAANTATAAVNPVTSTGAGGGLTSPVAGSPVGAAGTSANGATTQPVVFLSRTRDDPFQPVYLIPPPAPTPIPVTPDPQINIASPPGFDGGVTLPAIRDARVRAAVAAPLRIGLPSIPRLETVTAPRDAFPLARTQGEGQAGAPQQSYDKRLAGIIIGDGVRALLELPSGQQRVVQPGDEVEGIRVLNIERFRQGDRTITRMLVRDTDGSQRYVELKPSAQPANAGTEDGSGAGRGRG